MSPPHSHREEAGAVPSWLIMLLGLVENNMWSQWPGKPSPALCFSARAGTANREDYQEAHPWGAPYSEDNIWSSYPEVPAVCLRSGRSLGCSQSTPVFRWMHVVPAAQPAITASPEIACPSKGNAQKSHKQCIEKLHTQRMCQSEARAQPSCLRTLSLVLIACSMDRVWWCCLWAGN